MGLSFMGGGLLPGGGIGYWTSALIASGAASFNDTEDTPDGQKFKLTIDSNGTYPGPIYLKRDPSGNGNNFNDAYNTTGSAGPNGQMYGITHYTSNASNCNGDAKAYQSILSSMIARTATVMAFGMLCSGWNNQVYEAPQGCNFLNGNPAINNGDPVPITYGFDYLSKILSTADSGSYSGQDGCPVMVGPDCLPQEGCSVVNVFEHRPNSNPSSNSTTYWFNNDQGDAFALGLGKFGLRGLLPGSSSEYTTIPYLTTYNDNFSARGFTPNPTVVSGASIEWELGIPTVNSCVLSSDLDGDGVVSGQDLGMLLAAWGNQNDPTTDLDGDGITAGEDLAVLLSCLGS